MAECGQDALEPFEHWRLVVYKKNDVAHE
jgi:hypothetical protein